LSPVRELLESVDSDEQAKIVTIRQRNLDNLVSEDCIWRARQNLRNGLASEAVALLREALEWNRDHIGARVLLGDILASRGDHSAASEEFRAALAGNSELPLIQTRLKVLAAMGQQEYAAPQQEE